MMRMGGVPTLMGGLATEQPVTYKPPQGDPFDWSVIIGAKRGGEVYDANTGDNAKAIRMTVTGPRETLTAKGINTIQRNAVIRIDNEDWAIDVPESQFGGSLVRLGLIIRFTTQNQDMASHGAV